MSGPERTLHWGAPCPGVALDDNYRLTPVEYRVRDGVVVENPRTASSRSVAPGAPVTAAEVVGLLRFLKPFEDPGDNPARFFERAWFLELFANHIEKTRRDPVTPRRHIAEIRNIEGAHEVACFFDCPEG